MTIRDISWLFEGVFINIKHISMVYKPEISYIDQEGVKHYNFGISILSVIAEEVIYSITFEDETICNQYRNSLIEWIIDAD